MNTRPLLPPNTSPRTARRNGADRARTLFPAALRRLVPLLAVLLLPGCSLLKVAVSTGDPLPKEQARIRTLTRGFYYEMAGEVTRTADSIAALSHDSGIRIAAARWKIKATRAGVSAAMQGIPDVALADLWILCRRMNESFAALPDSLLFGPGSDLARNTAARLDGRIGRLARKSLDAGRYALMAGFVTDYAATHPSDEADSGNTTLEWIEYLEAHGAGHDYATGSISEVLADINDRVSGQTQQLSNSLGWSKEIIEARLGQDSLRTQLTARLDSLERNFGRLTAVAEHLPEISDRMLDELNGQVTQLILTMNLAVDNAFADFGYQRDELQRYISQERQELVAQLHDTGDRLLRTALDSVPGLVGRILLYVVLALAVLIGGPFALGFWLGGVRQRARQRKEMPDSPDKG